MASQEFLASFAVEIDEAGVSCLQSVLEENRELADSLAAAFSDASEAIREFAGELGVLPGFSGGGITEEGFSGLGGLKLGLDTGAAENDLAAFTAMAKKPISLSANASGMVSAARSAYNSIRSIFSSPVSLSVNVKTQVSDGSGGDGDSGLPGFSTGGRFTRPTAVRVAEDGDAEYIIPVKKEDRALPLLRQLLGELSPAARENLSVGDAAQPLAGGMLAGNASAAQVTQNNSNVSAPVNIQVHASGTNAERIGESIYDTAERYLVRTLEGVFA